MPIRLARPAQLRPLSSVGAPGLGSRLWDRQERGRADPSVIEAIGRRRVLRLPDERKTNALGERVLADRSAHPFGPDVTFQDIEARIDAGATVEVLDGPPNASDLLLVAVDPNGTVNLQPGSRAPRQEDTVIALVASRVVSASA